MDTLERKPVETTEEVEVVSVGSMPRKFKKEEKMTAADALYAAGLKPDDVNKVKLDGRDVSMDTPIGDAKRLTAVPKVRGGLC